jgi:hypothetical protein
MELGADDLLVSVAFATHAGAGVGEVLATGAAATDFAGRRVAFGPLMACAECDACRRGRLEACVAAGRIDASRSREVVVRRRWACPLDGTLASAVPGPEAALLGHDAVTAYGLVTRAGVAAGDVVLSLGSGSVPRLARAIARWLGAQAPDLALGPDADLAAWQAAVQTQAASAALPPVISWRVLATTLAAAQIAPVLAGALVGLSGAALAGAGELATALACGLRLGGASFGLPVAHPDLLPEVAALVGRGAVTLPALVAGPTAPGGPPIVDLA